MPLSPRRLLDGGQEPGTIGSFFDGLFDSFEGRDGTIIGGIGDAIEDAVGGADHDGSETPEALTRPQRVAFAVDGRVPGFFDAPNPWTVGLEVDPSAVAFAAVNGGAVLVFSVDANVVDALAAKVFSPRFALMWDDAIVAEQGTLNLDLTSKTILVALVGPPRGQRLTLWVTDSGVQCAFMEQGRPADANAIRQRVLGAASSGDGKGPVDAFVSFVEGTLNTQRGVAIAAVVIGGLILYMMAKAELKG